MHDPGGIGFRRAVGASLAVPLGRGVAGMSEDELVRRIGGGDEEAFAELCRRRASSLHALCRGILRNPEDAHDAVQSATEKALAALRRGQLRGDVRPWLTCICRNEALSLLRGRAPWTELDDGRVAAGPSPEATVLLRERLAGVAEDLAELPERQRRAIVLREVAELPYDHVARRLGMRQDAARQAVREARTALRDGAEGRDATCDVVRLQLSDGDGRRRRGRRVRSHLRICSACRTWDEGRGRPLPARAFLPGLWAALPGLWSWVPSAPALLAPGAGGGALSGAAQALAVAVAVALPVTAPRAPQDAGDDGRPAHTRSAGAAHATSTSGPAAGASARGAVAATLPITGGGALESTSALAGGGAGRSGAARGGGAVAGLRVSGGRVAPGGRGTDGARDGGGIGGADGGRSGGSGDRDGRPGDGRGDRPGGGSGDDRGGRPGAGTGGDRGGRTGGEAGDRPSAGAGAGRDTGRAPAAPAARPEVRPVPRDDGSGPRTAADDDRPGERGGAPGGRDDARPSGGDGGVAARSPAPAPPVQTAAAPVGGGPTARTERTEGGSAGPTTRPGPVTVGAPGPSGDDD